MRKIVRYWILPVVFLLLSVSSSSFAKNKGQGGASRTRSYSREGTKRPSGWDQGKKKGWDTDTPPGIEKKDDWSPPGLSKEEKVREREIKEKKIREEKTEGEEDELSSESENPGEEKEKVRKEMKHRLEKQKRENKSKGDLDKQE